MFILNDEHRQRAGIGSLSKRCQYCSEALAAYPLILSDDAGAVYHAACAAELATEILVDLYTFFRPPAPYQLLFVLTAQHAAPSPRGGAGFVSCFDIPVSLDRGDRQAVWYSCLVCSLVAAWKPTKKGCSWWLHPAWGLTNLASHACPTNRSPSASY
jgi:hypothetical protein